MYNDHQDDSDAAYEPEGPEAYAHATPDQHSSDSDDAEVTINIFNGEVENRRRPWDV